ncbi:DUF5060 domain-containing protein [candidate division KSB1 bacterium]|nr:DUF5060 domain-containing protein [candidate division KSB1 bacterium]
MTGELRQWHTVTLTFNGPNTSENATPNPFRDYRLQVTFTGPGGRVSEVPGFYAADGNAAESGATSGRKWSVRFVPDAVGDWTYVASFRTGQDVAIRSSPSAGTPTAFDGATGAFTVAPTNKTGSDFRGRGLLQYVGERYLMFAATGERFLKGGADSPENFLAYAEFDGTYDAGGNFLHRYEPHVADWEPGDPTWQGGKGKGIIGALNYLSGKGVNSVYFLTYNVDGGDGRDVWPWTGDRERARFDVSKLEQWEIVFAYMDNCSERSTVSQCFSSIRANLSTPKRVWAFPELKNGSTKHAVCGSAAQSSSRTDFRLARVLCSERSNAESNRCRYCLNCGLGVGMGGSRSLRYVMGVRLNGDAARIMETA